MRTRLEEEAGAGDTEVNIDVIVAADAEAAEEIIEAQNDGEASAEDEALAEANEEATQEAVDNAELAAVLRKNGCPAATAAVLKVLLPLDAYGISMPAYEALDATGRNQQLADHIASKLEAAAEGFWDSTKNFFKKVLNRIVQLVGWIADKFVFDLNKRLLRAYHSLMNRRYDEKVGKEKKFKDAKELDKVLGGITSAVNAVNVVIDEIYTSFSDLKSAKEVKLADAIKPEELAGIGYKFNSDGDGIEKDSNFKVETNETPVSEDTLTYLRNKYKDLEKMATSLKDLKKGEADAKKAIKHVDKFDRSVTTDDRKDAISAMRKTLATVSTLTGAIPGSVRKVVGWYVSACSAVRVATVANK